jgi:ABC-type nickel/cobalt efflux system permease component RcnA
VGRIETLSFAHTAAVGASLCLQAIVRLRQVLKRRRGGFVAGAAALGEAHCHHDDHSHVVGPPVGAGTLRASFAVVFSVGLRPCSGAVLILALAHAADMHVVGIGAVFAMSVGTAVTVSALAMLALGARRAALMILASRPGVLAITGQGLALLAGVLILLLGTLLLLGSLDRTPASPLF